jgi:hypothetical protein
MAVVNSERTRIHWANQAAWATLFLGNLIVPLSAADVDAQDRSVGMGIGIALVWLVGAVAVQRSGVLRRGLFIGGALLMLTQFVPWLQIAFVAAGYETASWLELRSNTSTPEGQLTAAGLFVSTLVAGALLMASALFLGLVLPAMFGVGDKSEIDTEGPSPKPASSVSSSQQVGHSRLGRLLRHRATWFGLWAVAWAFVWLRIVPPPSVIYYSRPPVEQFYPFALYFPLVAPWGLAPIFRLGPAPTVIFWIAFIWFMVRLKRHSNATLYVAFVLMVVLLGLMLRGWAFMNSRPGHFDL